LTGGTVSMKLGDDVLRDLIRTAPRSAYKHLREFTFVAWLSHRKAFLKQAPPKMGRGKSPKRLKFYRVGKNPTVLTKREVAWHLPKDRTAKSTADALQKWAAWDAAIYTGSTALGIHESGATIRSGKRMPVPVRTRIRDPEEWRKKYPQKRLSVVKRGGSTLLYEITGKRKKKARLRYVLTNKVINKPILNFYKTWDKLEPVRRLQLRKATDLIMADIELGKT